MANATFRSDRGRDPIGELARLIVQTHPHVESTPAESGCREETAWNGYELPPELPRAPQLQIYEDGPEQTSELDEHCDEGTYDINAQPRADEDQHQAEATRVRRPKLVVAIAMFSLVLAGTFGYRAMIGGSAGRSAPPIIKATNQPIKVAPAPNEPHAKTGANSSHVDTESTGSIENLVSREEQPVRIEPPKAPPRSSPPRMGPPATPPAAGQVVPSQTMPRVAGAEQPPRTPATVAVASQRAFQSSIADSTAAANRTHLANASLTPDAKATATETPPALDSGYAVQVASVRSETGAQAAFRELQAKYPQLGSRQAIIRPVDLGAAGTYYRALVGPFTSAKEATRLCRSLKGAGADCIIQKN